MTGCRLCKYLIQSWALASPFPFLFRRDPVSGLLQCLLGRLVLTLVEWHDRSILLAGRIWGKYKRDSERIHPTLLGVPGSFPRLTFVPPLPSNLSSSFLSLSLSLLTRYLHMFVPELL